VHGTDPATAHFARKRPRWFTKNVFNRIVATLTRLGLSLWGSRVLEVRGRSSGLPRRTPVNLLTFQGERYLLAPRGDTQWVRNLRVAGEGRLYVGRRSERFAASELPDEEKPPLLRAYLKRWGFEVAVFFDRVGADASEEELRRIAPKHPVFRLRGGAREASIPAPGAAA
jgi:deazaflavin-dependent oxidoreductase (nitroreductase family)